jgi:hypothetical protein
MSARKIRIVLFIEKNSLHVNLNGATDRDFCEAQELFSAIKSDIERLQTSLSRRGEAAV